jgi:hypothetical protein
VVATTVVVVEVVVEVVVDVVVVLDVLVVDVELIVPTGRVCCVVGAEPATADEHDASSAAPHHHPSTRE